MSDALLGLVFLVATTLSLCASWVLVSRLERVGARLGLAEALLGMLAALAADAPEITAAVTALAGHHARIGAGIVIGSNVFNLAALLGLSAVLAGEIALHRRVIALEGVVAVWVAAVCVAVVLGVLSAAVGLAMVLAVLVPYLVILGVRHERLGRLGLPPAWVRWLTSAIVEEELELEVAIHPRRGRTGDAIVAGLSVVVVVGASVAMEQTVSKLGTRHGIPEIVVGALILAAVTSLPNAVAAVYLARRGRGPATLSTAMNSNALNVAAGLLLPGVIVGLGASSTASTLIAVWYLGLTVFVLGCAYSASGLRRGHGVLIICAYLAFAGLILTSAYSSTGGMLLWTALPVAIGIALAAWTRRPRRTGGNGQPGAGSDATPESRSALDLATGPESTRESHADYLHSTASTNGGAPAPSWAAGDRSLVPGFSSQRIWYLALAISSIIAGIDASLGHHVILIGLLIAGPCCALLTGRWGPTASAGIWALALAILLGLPDGIWGSWTHIAFLGSVAVVAAATTAAAAVIQNTGWHDRP